jgi:hypothetical protein
LIRRAAEGVAVGSALFVGDISNAFDLCDSHRRKEERVGRRGLPAVPGRMDTGSRRVDAASQRLQERDGLRSRAGRRSRLVHSGRLTLDLRDARDRNKAVALSLPL